MPLEVPGATPHRPQVLKERYELTEILGEGGMGVVYKAWDRTLNRFIALKVIRPSGDSQNNELLESAFRKEAQSMLDINHHNIVRTFDFDVDGNQQFLTMELLEGETLEAVIPRYPSGVPWEEARLLLVQVLDGVEYAHGQNFIHSDLKPNNLFVTQRQVVKILDFGIAAKLRRIGDPHPNRDFDPKKYAMMCPPYACFEVFEQLPADKADDVYSLGCVFFELLSGRHPFGGRDVLWAMENHQSVKSIPSLSRRQNKAIQHALRFERKDRTQTVAAFRNELLRAGGTGPGTGFALTVGAIALTIAAVVATALYFRNPGAPSPSGALRAPAGSDTTTPAQPSAANPSAPAPLVDATTPAGQALPQPTPASVPYSPPIDSAPPIVGSPNSAPAESPSYTFQNKCGLPADNASLSVLLQRGLKAQTALALGFSDNDSQKQMAEVRETRDCLRQLETLGHSSSEARNWLRDADSLINSR